MDPKTILVFSILSLYIQRARFLVGNGVCRIRLGHETCCYGHFRMDKYCIPCPSGMFGENCDMLCPKNTFGKGCSKVCNCTKIEVWHPSYGCVALNVLNGSDYHNATQSTSGFTYGSPTTVTESGIPDNLTQSKGQGRGIFAYLSISDLAILGAISLLIVLVVINIIVSKRNTLKVKSGSYRINGIYSHGNEEMTSTHQRNPGETPRNDRINGAKRTTDQTRNATERMRRTGEAGTLGNQSTMTSVHSDDSWSDFDETETRDDRELVYVSPVADNREYFSFEYL